MNDLLLITGDSVSITPACQSLTTTALIAAYQVESVESAAEQDAAVKAQLALKEVLSGIEKARKEVKAPLLDLGRRIDAVAEKAGAEARAEYERIGSLVGSFQQRQFDFAQEQAKLARLEEEKIRQAAAVEAAKATTPDAAALVAERLNQELQQIAPAPAPVKTDGQVVKNDWEIEVFDVNALYRAHPVCVKMEPLKGEIRSLLELGVEKIPGVRARKVIKSGVRIGTGKVVDV